jgi:hypothetical protein
MYNLKEIKMKSQNSKIFSQNDLFIRTSTEFHTKVSNHNRQRAEWIGSGKKFSEIFASNSVYRQNIKRKNYSGNGYSIDQDLKWDLDHGWIKFAES